MAILSLWRRSRPLALLVVALVVGLLAFAASTLFIRVTVYQSLFDGMAIGMVLGVMVAAAVLKEHARER